MQRVGLPELRAGRSLPIRRLPVLVQAKKGFGGDDGEARGSPGQAKKSKRGKVASRPSREKQLAQLQAEEAAYQQQQLQARLGTTAATPRPATAAARADANDYDDDDDRDVSVPEQITDRMLQRMILFTGVPVLAGVLLLPGFYYLKKVQDLDIPVWAVYIVQSLAFGGGLLGITYGIVSASWDPRRDGSLLGWTEFQANLPLLLDRFKTKK